MCASLPETARGIAIIEVPTAGDRQKFRVPPGIKVRWVPRDESSSGADRPGAERGLCRLLASRATCDDLTEPCSDRRSGRRRLDGPIPRWSR
ncbi:SIP domain-containing protein [Dietzia sp. NCCP-2495]|uniref:SIP domain-containing protein n=1 Tax=Dietzia sp. NCCP-2495 TaxID=2934675 RepID=UPI0035CD3C0B